MILLISSVFPPEPVVSASLAYDLAVALSEITDIKVLTARPSRPLGFSFRNEKATEKNKFELIILKSFIYPKSKIIGRLFESYSFGRHASAYIKKFHSEIDCIYLNSWPLLAQFLIVKKSKKYKIPLVLHVQDIYPESLADKLRFIKGILIKILLPLDKFTLRNSSRIITISPGMRTYLIHSRGLSADVVSTVYNWQDDKKFILFSDSEKEAHDSSVFTFMFLGNLNITAGIDVLINAFKVSRIEKSMFIIAGNGSEKDYLVSLANNIKEKRIEFRDAHVSEVPKIQAKADILLLSLNKGAARYALPSKLSAYMFSARPIIACVDEDSDVADEIKRAGCGWVVPSGNIDELAEIMEKAAFKEKIELVQYGESGFNYAMNNYSLKNNLPKLVSLIVETANHR